MECGTTCAAMLSSTPRSAAPPACTPGSLFRARCATSRVRRGPAVGDVCHRPCSTGAVGVCGARARVTPRAPYRDRGAPPSRHPRPPRQPRQPGPRADLRGRFGLDGDFGGLQAPKVSAQPKVSNIFSNHRFRWGRARSLRLLGLPAPTGPWPSGTRVPLATGAAHAHGPASVCPARAMGDHRSIVASMVRPQAQLARSPLVDRRGTSPIVLRSPLRGVIRGRSVGLASQPVRRRSPRCGSHQDWRYTAAGVAGCHGGDHQIRDAGAGLASRGADHSAYLPVEPGCGVIIGQRVERGFGVLEHGHAGRSFERIIGGVRPVGELSQRDRGDQEGVGQFRGVVQPQGRDDGGIQHACLMRGHCPGAR